MFHYKRGMAYKTTADSTSLYADAPANTLLNDMFCYFVHHLPKFQNMHPYRIAADTASVKHVATTYPALPGPPAVPETYLFSKEMVAYLETLIAFCCYYRADDGRMSGRMEQFYMEALARYKPFKYPDWFEYIARKMTDWYKVFPLAPAKAVVDVDVEPEDSKVGSVVDAPAVVASGASGASRMSPRPGKGEGDEEPGVRDEDILPDGETAEDNVSAAAAAENRLALAAAAAAAAAAAGP